MDAALFKTAMSRLGAAVNLITTNGPAGRYGIVASAVCSVTDTPPTLLVCVNRASGANAVIKRNGVLAVNILGGRHERLSRSFASTAPDERFAGDGWATMETGAPTLIDAGASFDCRISSITEVGSHSVFFAEIKAIRVHHEVDGLVWFDRGYHRLNQINSRSSAGRV